MNQSFGFGRHGGCACQYKVLKTDYASGNAGRRVTPSAWVGRLAEAVEKLKMVKFRLRK